MAQKQLYRLCIEHNKNMEDLLSELLENQYEDTDEVYAEYDTSSTQCTVVDSYDEEHLWNLYGVLHSYNAKQDENAELFSMTVEPLQV